MAFMATYQRRIRRVATAVDFAYAAAVLAALLLPLIGGPPIHENAPAVVGIAGLLLAVLGIHAVHRVSHGDGETLRLFGKAIVYISNVVLIAVAWILYQATQPRFGPMFEPKPHTVLGVETAYLVIAVGVAGLIVGRLWIERILREGREPEANDDFWWSRA